jgi:hypothetical protein
MAIRVVEKSKGEKKFAIAISLIGLLAAISVSPFLNFEPINLIKLVFLTIGASYLLPGLLKRIFDSKGMSIGMREKTLAIGVTFLLLIVVNVLLHLEIIVEVLFGVFGRNNGAISYIALLIVFLSALYVSSTQIPIITRMFAITGNIVLGYAIVQLMGLDPIDWTGEGPFSTLGNLNFSAAFMAMHASLLFVQVFLVPRNAWHTRIWFSLVLIVELFVIWETTSIQGLAMIAIVSILLLIRSAAKRRRFLLYPLLGASFLVGIISILGSLGFGPLSMLRQDTMLFRLDYWTTGISIAMSEPLFGIGMDSYGNFYREYRNQAAATRNYFDRTANTAHNIPIDVAAGAGLFAGICFLALLMIPAYLSLKAILFSSDINQVSISAVSLGFVFQQFVSINQIGTAVWGWIFLGLVINAHGASKLPGAPENQVQYKSKGVALTGAKKNAKGKTLASLLLKGLLVSVGLTLALIPLVADANFSKAVRNGDRQEQWQIAKGLGGNQYLMEFSLKSSVASNNPSEIFDRAMELTKRYPRSYYGWSVRAGLITNSIEDRQRALDYLRLLDPLNTEIPKRPLTD